MPLTLARPFHVARLTALLRQFPVVAALGARQVGKTTLARDIVERRTGRSRTHSTTHSTTFDLEDSQDLARLADPLAALRAERGLVVIDEVQRLPDLFRTLRVLVDEPSNTHRFLVLGSAAHELLRQGSETLAGRIAYHEVEGFRLDEVGVGQRARLWLRGGFPRAFLARTDAESRQWREEFIRTFLERDIPQLGLRLPAPMLRRF